MRDDSPMSAHHELCFGCGRVNLFGLLMEVEQPAPGTITGQWFAKQDHQGPVRGRAHPGIVACALLEAVMLAAEEPVEVRGVKLAFEPGAEVEVGRFCEVSAHVERGAAGEARATIDGELVARLRVELSGTAQTPD